MSSVQTLVGDVGAAGVRSSPKENNSDPRSSFYPKQSMAAVAGAGDPADPRPIARDNEYNLIRCRDIYGL